MTEDKKWSDTFQSRVNAPERTYTLAEITGCSAAPYAAALKEKNVERALRLFTYDLIDALKALPARPPPVAMKSDE